MLWWFLKYRQCSLVWVLWGGWPCKHQTPVMPKSSLKRQWLGKVGFFFLFFKIVVLLHHYSVIFCFLPLLNPMSLHIAWLKMDEPPVKKQLWRRIPRLNLESDLAEMQQCGITQVRLCSGTDEHCGDYLAYPLVSPNTKFSHAPCMAVHRERQFNS